MPPEWHHADVPWFRRRQENQSRGRPLGVDRVAPSVDPNQPAFLSKPEGAPVYHGFPTVPGAEVEGFKLGMITDFEAQPDTTGDGFVIAPDGTRAGLVWESEVTEPYFDEVLPPDHDRWGVWAVGVREPLRSAADGKGFLEAMLPELRSRWEAWKAGSG